MSHFECLKFEGDEAYADIEILDVVSFLARQVNEQKAQLGAETTVSENQIDGNHDEGSIQQAVW